MIIGIMKKNLRHKRSITKIDISRIKKKADIIENNNFPRNLKILRFLYCIIFVCFIKYYNLDTNL